MSPTTVGTIHRESMEPPETTDRLWTPSYALVCAGIFLLAGHHSLLLPAVPLYVHSLGGSTALIGVLLVLFSIVSVACRPLVGYLADTRSVRAVLVLGALILAVMGFAHLVPVLTVIAVVGSIRGLGWAAVNTASNTLVAQLAPAARRAEASSYFNLFQNASHGIFPALAVWLVAVPSAGYSAVFVLSGVLALAAAVLALKLPALPSTPQTAAPLLVQGQPGRFSFYEPRVLLATFLLAAVTIIGPATHAFLPLYATERGIDDFGWYFVVNTIAGVSTYTFLARAFDHIGRATSIASGFVLSLIGLVLLSVVSSLPVLLLAGILLTVAQATISSNTMALAIERADPRQRGAAFGTYTAGYSLGQGIGGLVLGVIAEIGGYVAMYLGAAGWVALALGITISRWSLINGHRP